MLVELTNDYDTISHQVGMIQHNMGAELSQLDKVLPQLSNLDALHTKVLMSEWIQSMEDMIQRLDDVSDAHVTVFKGI